MRADALIQIRVADATKTEWSAHADQHGLPLSGFIRNACRFAALIGHQRIADGLSDIANLRRELHQVGADLRRIANESPDSAPEIRVVLSRVNSTTDALSCFIRRRTTP